MSTTNPTDSSTEWEELQIKFGNLPERPKPITNEVLTNVAIDFAENQDALGRISLEELEKLEDDIGEAELALYRRKRIEELKRKKLAYKFGEIFHVGKDEYVAQVTEASKSCVDQRVVIHLYCESKPVCKLLNQAFTIVAHRHGDVKFCKAIGADVIPNFPETRTPTVLVYKNGVCEQQIIGSAVWGGFYATADCVEWVLWQKGVLSNASAEDDPRPRSESRQSHRSIRYLEGAGQDSDSSNEEERNADRRGYSSLAMEKALCLK